MHSLDASWTWMISASGLAAAQWASAILSVLAIIFALLAFISEQRRDNAQILAESRRHSELIEQQQINEAAHHNKNVDTILSVIQQGVNILNSAIQGFEIQSASMYVEWSDVSGIPADTIAVLSSAKVLLAVAATSAPLLKALSEVVALFERLSRYRPLMLASVAVQLSRSERANILTLYREIEACKVIIPTFARHG